jgi:hypothetical protein
MDITISNNYCTKGCLLMCWTHDILIIKITVFQIIMEYLVMSNFSGFLLQKE